jgi:hypothetical protein
MVIFTPKLHWAVNIPIVVIMVVMLVTYFSTACSNPGIQPRFSTAQGPDWAYYQKADSFRPPGTILCSEGHVLIQGVDHFCPWTGTTIGAGNINCFYYFTYSLCAGAMTLGGVVLLAATKSGAERAGI